MKLSLCMIVRNSSNVISDCLKSALPWVDEVVITDTGSTDDTEAVIRRLCRDKVLKYLRYEDAAAHPRWISDFSAARSVGWAAAEGDMLLWLDSDDLLVGGKELRAFLEQNAGGEPRDERVDSLDMAYDYQHDALGMCIKRLKRTRVARRGYWAWHYPVHELLYPLRPGGHVDECESLPFKVVHRDRVDPDHDRRSAERNLWICEQWEAAGHEFDARMWKNKGDALRALGRAGEAVPCYSECLEVCPDPEERYIAYIRRGDCHRLVGKADLAMDDYGRAERVFPSYKQAYLAMAECMVACHMFKQALVWADKADMAGDDSRSLIYNPAGGKAIPQFVRTQAFLKLERYDLAVEAARKLRAISPDNPAVEDICRQVDEAQRLKALYEGFQRLYDAQPDEEARTALKRLAPKELCVFPAMGDIVVPERPADKPWVAIYCHRTINIWGPSASEKGTGGSEDAVIHMSRGLAARGFHVEVYNSPPASEIGTDEFGVVWLPFHAWNAECQPDVFIGWRDTRFMSIGQKAKARYLWLQDIPQREWYTQEFVDSIDGILCISEAQAAFLPDLARPKVIITGNGVRPEECVDGRNDPDRFIYFSSPDRGLEQLLEQWGQIKAARPKAELHVFYGFRDIYMAAAERNRPWMELKEKIEALARQPGVVWRGMVGREELHEALAESGFWLYPTSFEEAFCTNAAKAQAMGCIPVTSRALDSSLPEVCGPWDMGPDPVAGDKIKKNPEWMARWTARVVEVARRAAEGDAEVTRHRKEMKAWARETLAWGKRADQWTSLFSAALAEAPETAQAAV